MGAEIKKGTTATGGSSETLEPVSHVYTEPGSDYREML
jgi:hypothetical protein